jgi:6-phosphogluconolactonase
MLHIYSNVDVLLTSLADFIVKRAKETILDEGRFSFVLSGGSSPKKLFELLASPGYRNQVEWEKIFFFFGDERYVPADHADSNFLMAKKAFLDNLNISPGQIFRVNTSLAPAGAASAYENDIRAYFGSKSISFDFVLLGLGDNSHTASLFPHTAVLHEKDALVKEEYIEEVKMYRITLTAPLINQAKCVAFLVYGGGKAEAVRHILEDDANVDEYPAQLINPKTGELHWFLDEPAASKIKH